MPAEHDENQLPTITAGLSKGLVRFDAGDYRYEYQTINNQRMHLARFAQTWNSISIPAAIAIYLALVGLAFERDSAVLIFSAHVPATAILIYSTMLQEKLEERIIDLYPRMLCLEYILGFYFLRCYLQNTEQLSWSLSGKGKKLKKFIDTLDSAYCSIEVSTTTDVPIGDLTPSNADRSNAERSNADSFWRTVQEVYQSQRMDLLSERPRSVGASSWKRDVIGGLVFFTISVSIFFFVPFS